MFEAFTMIRRIFKVLGAVFLLFLLAFGGLLLYSTLTDYRPEPGSEEVLKAEGSGKAITGDTLSLLIWNIGYAGLGAEMDFFNDGGKGVRPEEEQAARYLKAIALFAGQFRDSVDFMLLQEVDRNSKRSYNIDQMQVIGKELPGFTACFALNYDVKFVPVPFGLPYTPYGKTYGGLVSYSRFAPLSNTRIQYPGGFDWPTRLYMLDRCALEQRFALPSGKQLIVVNTHNTAYDATGEIKKEEMAFMKKRYEAEASKGNYVILGGDWNQVPPGFNSKHFNKQMPEGYTPQSLTVDQIAKDFQVSFDSSLATNRSNDKPYKAGETYTTLIDYFMTSPKVEVLSVRGIDMQFRWSDHQPVVLKVRLK